MERTDELTLNDFWRPLKEKYPDALEHYCTWIDKLKEDVYWKLIFATGNYPKKEPREYGAKTETRQPKAHELPAFLQIGIFLLYVSEHEKYATYTVTGDWQMQMEVYFKNKQWAIDYQKRHANINQLDHGAY